MSKMDFITVVVGIACVLMGAAHDNMTLVVIGLADVILGMA